jgi:hypothetical protein
VAASGGPFSMSSASPPPNSWAALLGEDEVEQIYGQLAALELARASQVCRVWHRAFRRVQLVPQWVGSLSRLDSVEDAVQEACSDALSRMRCKPDVAFVFATPFFRQVSG